MITSSHRFSKPIISFVDFGFNLVDSKLSVTFDFFVSLPLHPLSSSSDLLLALSMTNARLRLSSPNSQASQNVDFDRETPNESMAVGFKTVKKIVAQRLFSPTLFYVDVKRKGTRQTSYRHSR